MAKYDEASTSWFNWLKPWPDRLLTCAEVTIVLLIALIVIIGAFYEAIWILGAETAKRQERLAQSLKMLNENWKVGLLLLVPLFYRTIRVFLERVEEFGGMKAPRRQPPVGEKGDEIRPSELQKLPSEEVADPEAGK